MTVLIVFQFVTIADGYSLREARMTLGVVTIAIVRWGSKQRMRTDYLDRDFPERSFRAFFFRSTPSTICIF